MAHRFETEYRPGLTETEDDPGFNNGVFLAWDANANEILSTILGWLEIWQEVALVDYGVSDKLGQGYILLEWEECNVDPAFLDVLKREPLIVDFTTYTRELED